MTVMPSRPRGHAVWWALSASIGLLAAAMLLRSDDLLDKAMAQGVTGGGARGIYAFTGQLSARSWGLFMVDVDNATLWIYELKKSGTGQTQLELVAARKWMYDRYLEELNVDGLTPGAVEALVRNQEAARARGAVGARPAELPGSGELPGLIAPAPAGGDVLPALPEIHEVEQPSGPGGNPDTAP